MIKLVRKIFSRLFFFELDHRDENSVFLAGFGRSGTTWIFDIINYKNEYRYTFELFHPLKKE